MVALILLVNSMKDSGPPSQPAAPEGSAPAREGRSREDDERAAGIAEQVYGLRLEATHDNDNTCVEVRALRAEISRLKEALQEAAELVDRMNANIQGGTRGTISDPLTYAIAEAFQRKVTKLLADSPKAGGER